MGSRKRKEPIEKFFNDVETRCKDCSDEQRKKCNDYVDGQLSPGPTGIFTPAFVLQLVLTFLVMFLFGAAITIIRHLG